MKFQNDYTTLITAFKYFILLVYTMMDDLYKYFIPQTISKRRNVTTAKMSDSEIIVLSICSEVVSIDSKKSWYFFVKRNY